MSELVWNQPGDIYYESGISKGVLKVGDSIVPWNGLIDVREAVEGGDLIESYLDGVKVHQDRTSEYFKATLTAFMYPLEFEPCDGNLESENGLYISSQNRIPFNLCYRTEVVNDIEDNTSYNLNFLYNVTATPSQVSRKTVSRNQEPSIFKWDLNTVPAFISGFAPSTIIQVNSKRLKIGAIEALEELLYGSEITEPYFPALDELIDFIKSYLTLRVEVSSGVWTAFSYLDEVVEELPNDMFRINYETVIDHGDGSFTMTSG